MKPRHLMLGLAAAALALGAVRPAAAQVAREFQVVPGAGVIRFDASSALETSPFLGLDAAYFWTRNLATGFQLFTARGETDGDMFPLALMDFGDTTYVYSVSQPVTLVGAGASVQAHLPVGPVKLFGSAGAGVYRIYLDPRRTQAVERMTGPSASFGAGFDFAISERAGIRLEARDLVLLDYDRDALDPTVPYVRNTRIPDAIPAPPAAKDVIHNLRASIGFSFVPGGAR